MHLLEPGLKHNAFTLDRFIAVGAALHLQRVESGIRSAPPPALDGIDLRYPHTFSLCLPATSKPHPLILDARYLFHIYCFVYSIEQTHFAF